MKLSYNIIIYLTPLHWAVIGENANIVKILLENPNTDVNIIWVLTYLF